MIERKQPSVYAAIEMTSSNMFPSAEALVKSSFELPYQRIPWQIDPHPSFQNSLDRGTPHVLFILDREGLTTFRMRLELDAMCAEAAANNRALSIVIVEAF